MNEIEQWDIVKMKSELGRLLLQEGEINENLKSCDIKDKESLEKDLTEVQKDIIVHKVMIGIQEKEDAVRKVGFEFRELCVDSVIVGLITILQISNPEISRWIVNFDHNVKSIIITGLYIFFLSDKVINRAFQLSTVLEKKEKKPSMLTLFGIPSILDFFVWLAVIFIAYFLFLLIPYYDNNWGYLLTYIINFGLYSIFKWKIKIIYQRLNEKINNNVTDVTDRITIGIALIGLIISVIALLK